MACRKIGDIVVCENYGGFRVFSKISLNKEKLKMRKILCLSSGIALFCVAAVLYYNTDQSNNIDLRPVGEAEALTVSGGGVPGLDIQFLKCSLHSDAVTGCSATISTFGKSSDNPGGTYQGSGNVAPCGGNCAGYTDRKQASE
ncbi:MAG: hypothetical protein LBJ00_14965 [Planctomycetaceae bacterium]|nr:hypothetical protein [Planctomycetaceae bacterium]